jgi:autotransporter-associated beta strand protein
MRHHSFLRAECLINKSTNHQIHPMKLNPAKSYVSLMLVVGLFLTTLFSSHAATITKADNTTPLNQGASWVGGATPTSSDIARWDSTVTGANTVDLGATTNWAGIEILNPGGLVTITNSVVSVLSLGASGIDMSSATADLLIKNSGTAPTFGFSPVASQTWNVPSGRTLIFNNAFTIRDNANITINGSGNITNLGAIQVSAINSTNTVNHNAGTFSSGVATANAILFIGHSSNAATNGVGIYNLNGGTIVLAGSQEIRLGNQSAAGDGTLNVTSGVISNTGSSTKLNVGYVAGGKGAYNQSGGTVTVTTMNIAANNAVSSGTGVATNSGGVLSVTTLNIGTVQTGSLSLNNSGRLNLSGTATVGGPTGGSGTLNLNGGILNMASTSAALVTNALTAVVNANGISVTNGSSGNVTLAAPMTLGAGGITNVTLATTSGRNITYSGVLSGSGGIMVDIGGANIVALTGANSYSGGVIIKNGILESRTTQTTLGTGTVIMGGTGSSGATYRTGQNNTNAFTVNAPDSGTNIISANGTGANFTMTGPITLNGNLTLQTFDNAAANKSTATFTGGVTGTGDLLINNLGLGSNTVSLTTTAINPVGSITQQGTVTNGNTTISAAIGANVTNVTQNSASSPLILSGINSYSGDTTVNAGTLLVNSPGSLSAGSAVSVNANGTLGGNGTINGLVTVANGGTLSPGNAAIGTLTLNGNVVLSAGSTNVFEVDGTTPTNDRVVLGASVTYGGVLQIVPTGTFTNGQTFTLFSGPGATTAGNFSTISTSGTNTFSFTNGVLTVVSPGPSGPATLTNSFSAGVLTLAWPGGLGWRLEQQTNALSKGLSTNWVDVTPGSASTTNITVDNTIPTVFYRLVYP